jgi:hypothetical protein
MIPTPGDLILSCGRLKVVAEPSILMTPYPPPHAEKNADVRKGREVRLHPFGLARTHVGSTFLILLPCAVAGRFSNHSGIPETVQSFCWCCARHQKFWLKILIKEDFSMRKERRMSARTFVSFLVLFEKPPRELQKRKSGGLLKKYGVILY